MKLLATPTSPYGRVVRILSADAGLDLPLHVTPVRDAADEILQHNPAAKVPSLLLDDGTTLSDSRLICEHLLLGQDTPYLCPVTDTLGRHWEGLVQGFFDGAAVWIREMRRPEEDRSANILALEERRALRCLDHFEAHWPAYYATLPRVTFASASLFSALDTIDRRFPNVWKPGHAQMVAWHATFGAIAHVANTAPPVTP